MSDWPGILQSPQPNLHSFSGPLLDLMEAVDLGVTGTGTWPTSNLAIFMPVLVEDPATVLQMAIDVGTQSGNLDLGIYLPDGARLVSKGSTAVGTAGCQLLDTTDQALTQGVFYLAMSCDNTTAAFMRSSNIGSEFQRICGIRQMASAHPLPSTATFANPSNSFLPAIVGVTAATL